MIKFVFGEESKNMAENPTIELVRDEVKPSVSFDYPPEVIESCKQYTKKKVLGLYDEYGVNSKEELIDRYGSNLDKMREIRERMIEIEKEDTISSSYFYPRYYNCEIDKGSRYRKELIGEHENSVYTLQVLPSGDIVSGGCDKKIYLWRLKNDDTYEQKLVGEHEDYVSALQVLPSGDIVSGGCDKKIYLWRLKNDGTYEQKLVGEHKHQIETLQVLPSGDIVSGGCDEEIYLWRREQKFP